MSKVIHRRHVMPKRGQFVAIWLFGGKLWSGTFEWHDGYLMHYDERTDDFEMEEHWDLLTQEDTRFFKLEGNYHE